jgi:hypothetical protein
VTPAIPLDQAVTETSLSGLQFTGATTPGTDEMWLRAYNGTWSGWTLAKLTDQGLAGAAVSAPAGNDAGGVNGISQGPSPFLDTVVGFDDGRIDRGSLTINPINDALTHPNLVNGGRETPITLGDSSAILPKGVSNFDSSLFA